MKRDARSLNDSGIPDSPGPLPPLVARGRRGGRDPATRSGRAGGIGPGYELKLNSYDLGVDIELHDAVERLRFEHPEVGAVVVTSARDRVFSAGANIRMLGRSGHSDKVNFCKFTNETRNAIEDACAYSGQRYLAA